MVGFTSISDYCAPVVFIYGVGALSETLRNKSREKLIERFNMCDTADGGQGEEKVLEVRFSNPEDPVIVLSL